MDLSKLNHEPEISDLLDKANKWLILGPSETSLNDYLKLLNRQVARCSICDATSSHGKRLNVDHDHNTTNLRGLLCQSCNCGLGHFLDSRDVLLRANQYLKGNLKTFVCDTPYDSLTPGSKLRAEIKRQFLEHQNNKCLICNKLEENLHLDHCHKTNKVRGLLCKLCNYGLGQFKDNPVLLLRANLYLKKHQKSA